MPETKSPSALTEVWDLRPLKYLFLLGQYFRSAVIPTLATIVLRELGASEDYVISSQSY
jgi:hypothetical protein